MTTSKTWLSCARTGWADKRIQSKKRETRGISLRLNCIQNRKFDNVRLFIRILFGRSRNGLRCTANALVSAKFHADISPSWRHLSFILVALFRLDMTTEAIA